MAFFQQFGMGGGRPPKSTDNKLYEELGVSRNCTDAELKKVGSPPHLKPNVNDKGLSIKSLTPRLVCSLA